MTSTSAAKNVLQSYNCATYFSGLLIKRWWWWWIAMIIMVLSPRVVGETLQTTPICFRGRNLKQSRGQGAVSTKWSWHRDDDQERDWVLIVGGGTHEANAYEGERINVWFFGCNYISWQPANVPLRTSRSRVSQGHWTPSSKAQFTIGHLVRKL